MLNEPASAQAAQKLRSIFYEALTVVIRLLENEALMSTMTSCQSKFLDSAKSFKNFEV
jgi:hypothetical protein